MIEAHRVPRLCLPALTTGSAQCSGLKNTREMTIQGAHCCSLERVSHLIVYPPSLSPSSCAWTAPQKQGDDECSSLSVAEHNFHKMPTIFTKCPQSNVFCFHKILLLTPVSLQIWFLFISDFRLTPLSVHSLCQISTISYKWLLHQKIIVLSRPIAAILAIVLV